MKRYAWVFRALITVGLLYAVLRAIPARQVARAILEARPGYVLLGLLCSVLVSGIEAIKLKLLLAKQGVLMTARQILAVNMAARFYGLFLPGYLSAGVWRWYRFSQTEQRWGAVLAAVAFSRVIDTVILVVLGLGFWALAKPTGGQWLVGPILFGILGLLLAAHLTLFAPGAGGRSWGFLKMRILHWLPGTTREKLERLAKDALAGYQRSHGLTGMAAGLSLLAHLGGIASFFCYARSLDIELSIIPIGWIRAVVVALTMLPISMAGLGVREGSLVLLLPAYGVAAADALALSLLLFAAALAFKVLGGVVELRYAFQQRSAGTRSSTDP